MKGIRGLKKPIRVTVYAVNAVLIVFITLIWSALAFITVHKAEVYRYDASDGFKTIAHRGYSGKFYDNTAQSFIAASESSFFDGIETDIRKTADGVWVCSHDDNPFADKKIKITESKYDDIKALPLDVSNAQKGASLAETYVIPLYKDFLSICDKSRKHAVIEIKGKYSAEELAEPVSLAVETLGRSRVTFGGFDLSNLEHVLEADPFVNVIAFAGNSLIAYAYTGMGYGVGVNKKILTEKRITRAHDKDTAIAVYTVTTEEEYRRFVEMGADYIITNYAFN